MTSTVSVLLSATISVINGQTVVEKELYEAVADLAAWNYEDVDEEY